MNEKIQKYLICIGGSLLLGLQMSGNVPGYTDQSISSESMILCLGIGAAVGFFVGLVNLSKANPNPYKVETFLAFFIGGILALAINLHRGFVSSNFGFNIASVFAITYLPCMLVGGYASSVFSKNA